MKNETTKPIATRISLDEFAKLLDSLIEKGVPAEKLMTNSNIMKTAMYMMIATSSKPTDPATQESIDTIKQLWKVTKRDKKIDLDNLY